MKFLLDSSALFAHLFAEPGADQVRSLFHDPQSVINLSVVSALELFAALHARDHGEQFEDIWERYRQIVDHVRGVDEAVVTQAIALRRVAGRRLPNGDALIAATAVLAEATLVHRDAHFSAIPSEVLRQWLLPDK